MDNTKPMKSTKIYAIIITALFAALTAVFSQISIPIGPVPVNLALLAVFTAAGLLSPGRAVLSQVVYLLLGRRGRPGVLRFPRRVCRACRADGRLYCWVYCCGAYHFPAAQAVRQKNPYGNPIHYCWSCALLRVWYGVVCNQHRNRNIGSADGLRRAFLNRRRRENRRSDAPDSPAEKSGINSAPLCRGAFWHRGFLYPSVTGLSSSFY